MLSFKNKDDETQKSTTLGEKLTDEVAQKKS